MSLGICEQVLKALKAGGKFWVSSDSEDGSIRDPKELNSGEAWKVRKVKFSEFQSTRETGDIYYKIVTPCFDHLAIRHS